VPEGKEAFATPRRGSEDIKVDVREIRFSGVDWIHLSLIETGGGCKHNEPSSFAKCGERLD
jgi:hypothetical protein